MRRVFSPRDSGFLSSRYPGDFFQNRNRDLNKALIRERLEKYGHLRLIGYRRVHGRYFELLRYEPQREI